jgi:acyl carrier protein
MNLRDEVKAIIAKGLRFSVDHLEDGQKLGDLGAESIDVIEIVFALEEKFDIDIDIDLEMRRTPATASEQQRALSDISVGDVCRAVQALVNLREPKGADS